MIATNKYIIALDQGTTSSRAVLFNENGSIEDIAQQEFTQYFPEPGHIEHDPMEIWESQWNVFTELVHSNNISATSIAAIGITNQRETTVVWDKNTGIPIYNAIVWQDRRTASICESIKSENFDTYIRQNTGLVIDAYFSATKIKWILDNVDGARQKADNNDLLFGTIDTWLIWKLTNAHVHATDYSNASRTMLYNIRECKWDTKLTEKFSIPETMLPEVKDSSGIFGYMEYEGTKIPIAGVAGDQQAALFGQACIYDGMAKNTYGTGCFLLMNTGETPVQSHTGLLTTIAWGINGNISYALEGSVFVAGAAIQWLRDGLKIIDSASESEALALEAGSVDDVYVVPAFTGLGAPYWDMYARGAIFGLTRDTKREHIVKATLNSLAFQTRDVLDAMQKDAGIKIEQLQVDGGACANNYLMQFQSNILGIPIERPTVIESTARGAAYLAGIGIGLWKKEDINKLMTVDKLFKPSINKPTRDCLYAKWQEAVKRSMNWKNNS